MRDPTVLFAEAWANLPPGARLSWWCGLIGGVLVLAVIDWLCGRAK